MDTTVQQKAIAHPTAERCGSPAFSRLYLKALLALVRQARKASIKLRQSHTRLAKRAAVKAGRYAHAKQFKRMRRELKRLGNEQLRIIAHELLEQLRNNVTVAWYQKDSARAKMRILIKRILKEFGYPPDLSQAAVQTVIEQAELWLKEAA